MGPILSAMWGTKTAKIITVFGGAMISIFGAITAAHTAWPIVDPYMLAHRGYVQETIKPLQLAMDKQAVATDRQSVIILKGQLSDAVRDPAANSSPIVKERIEELKREIEDTATRIQRSIGTAR